jgi:hypothetical protein
MRFAKLETSSSFLLLGLLEERPMIEETDYSGVKRGESLLQ